MLGSATCPTDTPAPSSAVRGIIETVSNVHGPVSEGALILEITLCPLGSPCTHRYHVPLMR